MRLSMTLLGLMVTLSAQADQNLLLIGGGRRPPEALERFVLEGGGRTRARILVITWATEEPAASFDSIRQDFTPYLSRSNQQIKEAPRLPLARSDARQFLDQLNQSTALFFVGGSQNRLLNALNSDATIREAVLKFYGGHHPVAGTSAGAMVLSYWMLTGLPNETTTDPEDVIVTESLGLLPDSLVDTHFYARGRQERLRKATALHPGAVGIGIDEDTAVWIRQRTHAEVLGPSRVMTIQENFIREYGAGETFELPRLHSRNQ